MSGSSLSRMSTFCHWMIENSIDNILHRVMHASVSTASWRWRAQWTRLFLLSNDLVCWSYIVCSCFCFSTKRNVHIVIIVLKHKFEEEGYHKIFRNCAGHYKGTEIQLWWLSICTSRVPRHWSKSYYGMFLVEVNTWVGKQNEEGCLPQCIIIWRPE